MQIFQGKNTISLSFSIGDFVAVAKKIKQIAEKSEISETLFKLFARQ